MIVVINQDVSSDCCLMVCSCSTVQLRETDITSYAIDQLTHSAVESVTVAGRRGHVQAAFTIKEVREVRQLLCARVNYSPFCSDIGWVILSSSSSLGSPECTPESNRDRKSTRLNSSH